MTPLRLHSNRHPELEASRFLDSLNLGTNCPSVLVIGPGQGWLFPELRKRYPQAGLFGIQLADNFFPASPEPSPPPLSYANYLCTYSNQQELESFLDKSIGAFNSQEIKIIHWKPSLLAWPEIAKIILKTIKNWQERKLASDYTAKSFGKLWIKNALYSLQLPHSSISSHFLLAQSNSNIPIVICASGPSLEYTAETILKKTNRQQYILIAVSSALNALLSRNIYPDIVVASDPTYWASLHLHRLKNCEIPLIYQLGAKIPHFLKDKNILATSTGEHWQNALLQGRDSPFFISPQRGTVSAFALDIAFQLSRGGIYFAGLDFASRGILSHARPWAFEQLAIEHESRLFPQHQWFENRHRLQSQTKALNIYATWFENRGLEIKDRCRILSEAGKNYHSIQGSKVIEIIQNEKNYVADLFVKKTSRPNNSLKQDLNLLSQNKMAMEELSLLLFSKDALSTSKALTKNEQYNRTISLIRDILKKRTD